MVDIGDEIKYLGPLRLAYLALQYMLEPSRYASHIDRSDLCFLSSFSSQDV